MGEETIQDQAIVEFNQLVEDFVAREDGLLEPSVFLRVMA
jgi:hypothetical protein